MEEIKKYKGSIPMAGGLYPASGGEYPLINTALIEKDSVSGQRLDKYLEEYPYPFIYVGTATNKEALDSLLPETEDSDNRSFIAFNKGEQVYYARSPITKEWTVCSASISEIANSVEGASLIGIGDDVNEFIDISSVKAYINTGEENDEYQLIEKQDLMSDDTFSKEEKNKIKSALGVESGIRVSNIQPDGSTEMIDVWINTSEEEETVELVSKSDLQDSSYFTDNQKDLVREAIGAIGVEDIAQELGNDPNKVLSQEAAKKEFDNVYKRVTEEKIGKNLLSKDAIFENLIVLGNGNVSESENYATTDFIEVISGETISFIRSDNAVMKLFAFRRCVSFDSNKNVIADSVQENVASYTIPEEATYIRMSFTITYATKYDNLLPMIIYGQEPIAFEPYRKDVLLKYDIPADRVVGFGERWEQETNNSNQITYVPTMCDDYNTSTEYMSHTNLGGNLQNTYSLYDGFVEKYPNYVTKSLVGNVTVDSEDLPIYRYDFTPPVVANSKMTKLCKVILTTCTHGHEVMMIPIVYRFIKDICENWKEQAMLRTLRFNCQFTVIPIVNPYGYINSTRKNENGVDINRNFPNGFVAKEDITADDYGGKNPLSEQSAVIMYELLNSEKFDFGFDIHAYGTFAGGGEKTGFIVPYIDKSADIALGRLYSIWASTKTLLASSALTNYDKSYFHSIESQYNGYLSTEFSHGMTIEFSYGWGDESLGTNETAQKLSVEHLGVLVSIFLCGLRTRYLYLQ